MEFVGLKNGRKSIVINYKYFVMDRGIDNFRWNIYNFLDLKNGRKSIGINYKYFVIKRGIDIFRRNIYIFLKVFFVFCFNVNI